MKPTKEELAEELEALRVQAVEARNEADHLTRLYYRAKLTHKLSGIERTPDPALSPSGERMRNMNIRKRKSDGYWLWLMRFGIERPELISDSSDKMIVTSFWESLEELRSYACVNAELLGNWIIPILTWSGVTKSGNLNYYGEAEG